MVRSNLRGCRAFYALPHFQTPPFFSTIRHTAGAEYTYIICDDRGARFIDQQLKQNLEAVKKRDKEEMANIKRRCEFISTSSFFKDKTMMWLSSIQCSLVKARVYVRDVCYQGGTNS